MDAEYNPDATMSMTAVGVGGLLIDGGAEGLFLTNIADAWGWTPPERFPWLNSPWLKEIPPWRLVFGKRETCRTGFGRSPVAGLSWADSERGISAELKGGTLLTHVQEDFQNWGMAVSFAGGIPPPLLPSAPSATAHRAPSLSVSHAMGTTAKEAWMPC